MFHRHSHSVYLLGASRSGFSVVVLVVSLLLGCRSSQPEERVAKGAPRIEPASGYAGSGACRACHPGEYASYRETYHATMTRYPRDVPFDGDHGPMLPLELSDERRIYRMFKETDGIYVEGPDLHLLGALLEKSRGQETEVFERFLRNVPKVKRPLALVTGSHHYLAFWLSGGEGRELRQLPFVYLLSERRFLPRSAAFVAPTAETLQVQNWNGSCIQCHTTGFAPRESEGESPARWVRYDSSVTDLSIACEACHGPSKAHVDRFRSPLSRMEARQKDEPTPDVLSPAHLSAEQSSALCGQCHAYFVPRAAEDWWDVGFKRSPPAHLDYAASRVLLALERPDEAAEFGVSSELRSIFWSDGSVRVGGREYQGLLRSPCFKNGSGDRKLSCVTCHQMHGGTRADALPHKFDRTKSCQECHTEPLSEKAHASHQGRASCVDCHMPMTSYALLGAVRSHEIGIPRPTLDPPSACIVCHLDKSERWLQGALAPDASPPEGALVDVPLGPRMALSGDAGARAIVGDWLATKRAHISLGEPLVQYLLAELAKDDYQAVAEIAKRSARGDKSPGVSPPYAGLARSERDTRPVVISE